MFLKRDLETFQLFPLFRNSFKKMLKLQVASLQEIFSCKKKEFEI